LPFDFAQKCTTTIDSECYLKLYNHIPEKQLVQKNKKEVELERTAEAKGAGSFVVVKRQILGR
jgi:hypothetical protein